MMRASATQRCPNCKRTFRVLEDEQGQHECPHCGYGPEDDQDPDICDTCKRFKDEHTALNCQAEADRLENVS